MSFPHYFNKGRCGGGSDTWNGRYCRDAAGPERWCINCAGFVLQNERDALLAERDTLKAERDARDAQWRSNIEALQAEIVRIETLWDETDTKLEAAESHLATLQGALKAKAEEWRARRAHTYSSENADEYRAYDAGQMRCADELDALTVQPSVPLGRSQEEEKS